MRLQLRTEAGCGLAIGGYPTFRYDASGGGGTGRLGGAPPGGTSRSDCGGVVRSLEFDPQELRIPALSWRSTRVLGVPLPPGLRIVIEPLQLRGQLDPGSGELRLRFQARFHCAALGLYRPAALSIDTELGTGPVRSRRHSCQGTALDARGRGVLVGVAQVPPSGDRWLDRFLGLPDEALAVLRCQLTPVGVSGG